MDCMAPRIPTALIGLSTLLLLAAPLVGCKGKDREKPVPPTTSPVAAPPPPRATKDRPLRSPQRVSVKRDMKKIQRVTDELRRRAQGQVSMRGPSKLMLNLAKALPAKSYPASFQAFLDTMVDQLKALPETKDHFKDYNALIDTCVACHRFFAPRTLHAMRLLRLSARPAAKTPARGTKVAPPGEDDPKKFVEPGAPAPAPPAKAP